MKRARGGFALLLALAGILVLAGLSALANVAAIAAIRESVALRDEAQAAAARNALRARLARVVMRVPRSALLSQRIPLGGGDTALVVTPLSLPWHRVEVFAGGVPVIAEVARATIPPVPWCASAVVGGAHAAGTDAFANAPSSECVSLVAVTSPAAIASFANALAGSMAMAPEPGTLRLTGQSGAPEIWRAAQSIEVEPGASVVGVVMAPVVRIAMGAVVRGMVIVAESLVVAPGGSSVADSAAVRAALTGRASLHLMGRRGLLLPP